MSRTFGWEGFDDVSRVYDGLVQRVRGRGRRARPLLPHARRQLREHLQRERRAARLEVPVRRLEVQPTLHPGYTFIRFLLQQS